MQENVNITRKIHVVIVDDDLDNRYQTTQDFTSIGWAEQVHIVEAPHQLLSYLDGLSDAGDYPTLIVVDYMLRQMNGEELYHHLKQHPLYGTIPVAFYSSNLDANVKSRLNALGIQYFKRPMNGTEAEVLAQEIKAVALSSIN